MISTHIRTEGLYLKTTIIYQLKRLCVPDCAYTENIFMNSIHISLYDISLTQNILYQIKRDVAVWKRLGCPQRNLRTWWQIMATPYAGLAWLLYSSSLVSRSIIEDVAYRTSVSPVYPTPQQWPLAKVRTNDKNFRQQPKSCLLIHIISLVQLLLIKSLFKYNCQKSNPQSKLLMKSCLLLWYNDANSL